MLVGAMRLNSRIGRGGMGEVWKGHHLQLNTPIALKVLRTPDPQHRIAFANEIRAISTLTHPNIITIVEQGTVGDDCAPLPPNSPYLAMELAEGSIIARQKNMDWAEICSLLLDLLSALAHAHAHGLLHGDLKPGNVLWVKGIIKLTDFGLSRRVDLPPQARASMGTPRYMAPEQAVSRWREAGPWTDLFSLGRLVEALVYGRPGGSTHHPPRCAIPVGLDGWLARLLIPEPQRRFQQAADAAHALRQLPPPSTTQMTQFSPLSLAEDTFDDIDSQQVDVIDDTWGSGANEPLPSEQSVNTPLAPRRPPPLPQHCHSTATAPNTQRHGLSLVGLRTPHTIGREKAQQELWNTLRAVSEGTLQVCLIDGEVATGKRRLAHWLSQNAQAIGGIPVLTARHTERGSNAMGRMLASHFHCIGLPREGVQKRVTQALQQMGIQDHYDSQGLTEVISPSENPHITAHSARFSLLQRHLSRLVEHHQRPVVLQLENAQWGQEALAFALHLLRARNPPPILVLITWSTVPDRPLETRTMRALLRHSGVINLHISPLRPRDMFRLAHDALGLAAAPARVVAGHSHGSPLFAVHLVRHWAQQDKLQMTPQGLVGRPGVQLSAPESLHALWLARLDHTLAGLSTSLSPTALITAVELASLLDGPVEHSEWVEACSRAGIGAETQLVTALLSSGLARCPTRDPLSGWRLVHWTLREAVERRAIAEGRMPALHRACAWLLAERRQPAMALRLARHLLAAGEDAEALEPLRVACRRLIIQGAFRQADTISESYFAAMDRLQLPDDDPQRHQGLMLAAHIAQSMHDFSQAESLIDTALSSQRPRERIMALQQLCRLRREQGRLVEARGVAQQALRMAERINHPLLIAHCHRDRANILLLEGDFQRTEAAHQLALTRYEEANDDKGIALTHKGLGRLYTRQSQWDKAIEHIAMARGIYRRLHEKLGECSCLNALGEVARLRGDLQMAEGWYLAALEGLRKSGQLGESIAEINLALVQVEQGRFVHAEAVLRAEQHRNEQSGQQGMATLLGTYRLPGLIHQQQWEQAWSLARDAKQAAEQSNLKDPDAARFSNLASRLAAEAGRGSLAKMLSDLSKWHQP